jgi:hypothetical protein
LFRKVNVWVIVIDHIQTLRNFANNRVSAEDILLFLVIPIAASLLLTFVLRFELNIDAINALITSLSVFSALLFNLLLLIYDILRKESGGHAQSSLRRKFLGQIYANISFSILVAVISIALLLLLFIETRLPYFTLALNLVIYFMVINFILTMLMILKRVHILLASEINPPKKSPQ